jgi:hypothetical protein
MAKLIPPEEASVDEIRAMISVNLTPPHPP